MKKLSKIVSLVMALAMLAVMMVVPSNAAMTESATFKVKFYQATSSDSVGTTEISSATAGQFIDAVFVLNSTEYICNIGLSAAFKSDNLKHVRFNAIAEGDVTKKVSNTNGFAWLDRFTQTAEVNVDAGNLTADEITCEDDEVGVGKYYEWGASSMGGGVHADKYYPATWGDAEKAEYKTFMWFWRSDATKVQLLANTHGNDESVIRVRFYALTDIASLADCLTIIGELDTENNYLAYKDGSDYDYGAVFSCMAAESVIVDAVDFDLWVGISLASASTDIKCRWKNGDTASTLQLGILGTIKNTAITADNDVAVELTACGVLASSNGALTAETFVRDAEGVVEAPCGTLYVIGNGVYKFRAVMDNVPYDATATVYYRTYAVIGGTTFYSDIVSTTGTAQYARATAAGLATYTGA